MKRVFDYLSDEQLGLLMRRLCHNDMRIEPAHMRLALFGLPRALCSAIAIDNPARGFWDRQVDQVGPRGLETWRVTAQTEEFASRTPPWRWSAPLSAVAPKASEECDRMGFNGTEAVRLLPQLLASLDNLVGCCVADGDPVREEAIELASGLLREARNPGRRKKKDGQTKD